jgi:hypothetical protein
MRAVPWAPSFSVLRATMTAIACGCGGPSMLRACPALVELLRRLYLLVRGRFIGARTPAGRRRYEGVGVL